MADRPAGAAAGSSAISVESVCAGSVSSTTTERLGDRLVGAHDVRMGEPLEQRSLAQQRGAVRAACRSRSGRRALTTQRDSRARRSRRRRRRARCRGADARSPRSRARSPRRARGGAMIRARSRRRRSCDRLSAALDVSRGRLRAAPRGARRGRRARAARRACRARPRGPVEDRDPVGVATVEQVVGDDDRRPAAHQPRSGSSRRSRVSASSPVEGSSRISTGASGSSARAIATRWRCPPERPRPRSPSRCRSRRAAPG